MATATTPTPKKARTAAAKTVPPADIKATQRAANLLKMGGDATRVRVLLMLADGPRNVGEMCAAIGQSQPATSHHIGLLRHGGIVDVRRQAKNNFYSLTARGRLLAETARRLMAEDAAR